MKNVKVGDKVRVLHTDYDSIAVGSVQKVMRCAMGGFYLGDREVYFYDNEVEKIEEKAMNTKFKAMTFMCGDDSELFGRVVSMLNELGYHPDGNISRRNYVGTIMSTSNGKYFWKSRENTTACGYENINIDWLRTASPETIELNGKTYVKSELEEAIAKIKPVEGV